MVDLFTCDGYAANARGLGSYSCPGHSDLFGRYYQRSSRDISMFLNSFDQLADFIGITLTMMLGMSMR
jgi:hypothetical protein